MDATTPVLINKVLDGLTVRMTATARNIANANSPDFRPTRVTFEDALRAAAGRGAQAVRDVSPRVEIASEVGVGGEMRLDLELATASESAMRYAALIDLLGRQMQIDRIVVRGGQ